MLYLVLLGKIANYVRTDMATNSRKRQMWLQVCLMFTIFWTIIGIFIWPLLIFALFSWMMMLIPVGVSDDEPLGGKIRHNPEAWRRNGR